MRKEANPQISPVFGLISATRDHEGGIASNRESSCRGEYVPGSCTHRPSHSGNLFGPKQASKKKSSQKVLYKIVFLFLLSFFMLSTVGLVTRVKS